MRQSDNDSDNETSDFQSLGLECNGHSHIDCHFLEGAIMKNLTDTVIKSAKSRDYVWRLRDGAVKGLHLVITPAGGRSWGLSYTSPETGKRCNAIFPGFQYPDKSLAEAREEGQAWRKMIRDGIDPVLRRERQQAAEIAAEAERQTGTVDQLFDCYITDMEMDGKRSAKQARNIYIRDIKPRIGHLKASDDISDDIADILTDIEERGAPILAKRTYSYLQAAFNFGMTCKQRTRWRNKAPVFGITVNPVKVKLDVKEKPGRVQLESDEIKSLWNSIGVDALSADLAIAIKLLLSTGQRVEELLHATWSEFDLEGKLWTIPGERRKTRGKTDEPHLVPLTDMHIQLLQELKGLSRGKWLFPNEQGKAPRTSGSLSQALYRYCRPQGNSNRKPFKHHAPRDYRRTWKTRAAELRIDLEMRNRIQGHALQDIGSKHYDCWAYLDEKREAMEVYCTWLEGLVHGKKTAKIIQLRKY